MSKVCGVCCEKFTKAQRKPVQCLHCDYIVCAACMRQYVLGTTTDPDCMACHNQFDREFLIENLTKVFVDGEYRKHRETVLYDREVALLPTSQHLVQHYRLASDLRTYIQDADARILDLTLEIQQLRTERSRNKLRVERIVGSGFSTDGRPRRRRDGEEDGEEDAAAQRRSFIRACPVEECRGFLSTQWKCATCERWACPECHVSIGPEKTVEHMCDPNDVATARLLKRDTKPCPKCAVLIYKVDGCDQMWCTQCHVAFSWGTGRIETGQIHNPEYYRWLRSRSADGEIPRNPLDRPLCGGNDDALPGFWAVERALRQYGINTSHPLYTVIVNYHRNVRHVQCVEMRRQYVDPDIEVANRDLRLRYLLHHIDGPAWKRQLAIREKARNKRIELRQIYEMWCAVVTDCLRAVVQAQYVQPIDTTTVQTAVAELQAITEHANKGLERVARRYGNCSYYKITV